MTDTIESLRQQLAECQARGEKLREAVNHVVANGVGTHSILTLINALALPNDDTCLNELIAERTASLTAEVKRLKDEKEYRYVEQILSPIRKLLAVAKCAEKMANDYSEGIERDGNKGMFVHQSAFDELSAALDILDELPDDKPGYVLGGAAKAAWALNGIIGGKS